MIPIYRRVRITKLIEANGAFCHYCNRAVRLRVGRESNKPDDATLDHRVPRALGGGNADSNLLLACRKCNEAKEDRPYEDFIARPYRIKRPKPKAASLDGPVIRPQDAQAAFEAVYNKYPWMLRPRPGPVKPMPGTYKPLIRPSVLSETVLPPTDSLRPRRPARGKKAGR